MKIKIKFDIGDKVCYLAEFSDIDGFKIKKWVATEVYSIKICYNHLIKYLTDEGWMDENDLKLMGRELTEEEIDGGF